jgi:hypothetical protein
MNLLLLLVTAPLLTLLLGFNAYLLISMLYMSAPQRTLAMGGMRVWTGYAAAAYVASYLLGLVGLVSNYYLFLFTYPMATPWITLIYTVAIMGLISVDFGFVEQNKPIALSSLLIVYLTYTTLLAFSVSVFTFSPDLSLETTSLICSGLGLVHASVENYFLARTCNWEQLRLITDPTHSDHFP